MNSRVDKSVLESRLDTARPRASAALCARQHAGSERAPLTWPRAGWFPSDAPVSSGMTAGSLPVDHRAPCSSSLTRPISRPPTLSFVRCVPGTEAVLPTDQTSVLTSGPLLLLCLQPGMYTVHLSRLASSFVSFRSHLQSQLFGVLPGWLYKAASPCACVHARVCPQTRTRTHTHGARVHIAHDLTPGL